MSETRRYGRLVWLVLYWPVSALVRMRYVRMDRIPKRGPAIIVLDYARGSVAGGGGTRPRAGQDHRVAPVLREMTDLVMRRLRDDVAELRCEPSTTGDLFARRRAGERPGDAA